MSVKDKERAAAAERFAAGVEKAAAQLHASDQLRGEAAFIASVVRERGGAPLHAEVVRLRAMHQRGLTAKQAVSRLNQGLS